MLRALAVLSLSLIAIAEPSYAAAYKDPDGRFDVTVPEGWINVEIKDRTNIALVIGREPNDQLPGGAVCIALYAETPETRGRSQDELNKMFDQEMTPDFWEKAMKSSGKNDNTKVENSGTREKSGRKISYIVFTDTTEEQGKKFNGKGRMEFHIVPGSLHFVMCGTEVTAYDSVSAEFESVFASYEPHGNAVVASLEQPSRSMLTMFAGPNFGGAARVLAQDTPNLAAAGWPTATAALAVDGVEPWQVCDRAGYSGTCRTIAAAELAATGQQLTIASARRLAAGTSIQGIVATSIRRALQHPATRRAMGN